MPKILTATDLTFFFFEKIPTHPLIKTGMLKAKKHCDRLALYIQSSRMKFTLVSTGASHVNFFRGAM